MGTDVPYHGSSNQAAGNSGSMSEGSSFLPCLRIDILNTGTRSDYRHYQQLGSSGRAARDGKSVRSSAAVELGLCIAATHHVRAVDKIWGLVAIRCPGTSDTPTSPFSIFRLDREE